GDKLATAGVLTISIVVGTAHSEVPIMVTTGGVGVGVGAAAATIAALNPNSTIAWAPGATGNLALNVSGSGFDPTSVVVFNGRDVATHYNSPTSLDASVTSDLLVNAGMMNVAVRVGANVSAPLPFTITAPVVASSSGVLP